MDTSSLTKETNVMSQTDLNKLREKYSFPSGVQLRIPGEGETILSTRKGKVAFYEDAFLAGLRLLIHPTIKKILNHFKICPAQLSPNAWRSIICSLVIWRYHKRHMSCDEYRCLYSLSPLPDSGWYYFKARPEKNLLRRSPSNVKGWKKRFFFASGDEWEFFPSMPANMGIPRVPRSWGTPGESCNALPALTEVEAKRTAAIKVPYRLVTNGRISMLARFMAIKAPYRLVMNGYSELRAKQPESVIVKLLCIVRDNNFGNPKFVNDVFPYEIPDVLLDDLGERLNLYPLGEIVYGDNQKFPLQRNLWQRPEYVYAPMSKRPRAGYWHDFSMGKMANRGKSLTFVAFSDIGSCIPFHIRPKIPLENCLFCQ
ncbi:hypothetical protein Acr_18g0008660 [Actinidia rufa]|uniref:Transposase (putative) gypsy type domain-containing protein n=1 Tax=Actinidia rufa TaxID=165716 RepID=A0A7J0G7D3_9ERIC|nr:hypothetical protein Acr_18g0008660 [Actinidia rufa]